MDKFEMESKVQLIFDNIKNPFLSASSFTIMFETLQKEVKQLVQGMDMQQVEQIYDLVKDVNHRNLIQEASYKEVERFFIIEVLRKIIDEYFMTISNMPGFKKFFWEHLESEGFTHTDIFYK